MSRIDKLARSNIRDLVPYSSARDEYSGSKGIFLDANENPFGKLNRYPDPHHTKLRKAISSFYNIPVENIFLGNGSDEAIDLLFRIFCVPGRDRALTFSPTYGMYEVSAAVNDVGMIKVPLDPAFDIDSGAVERHLKDSRLKLIFICSPNNPTSNSFSREKIISVIEKSSGIVAVDEAYIDFSINKSLVSLIGKYRNLVILRTFSKAWGAAGIRIGMVMGNPEIIDLLYKVKPPYNISTLNQKAALRRMKEPGKYKRQIESIKSEKIRLIAKLGRLGIVEKIFPSDSNFLLVKVKDADTIYNILTEKSIIVRNRNSVVPGCLRITVGKKKENDCLLNELKMIRL